MSKFFKVCFLKNLFNDFSSKNKLNKNGIKFYLIGRIILKVVPFSALLETSISP